MTVCDIVLCPSDGNNIVSLRTILNATVVLINESFLCFNITSSVLAKELKSGAPLLLSIAFSLMWLKEFIKTTAIL